VIRPIGSAVVALLLIQLTSCAGPSTVGVSAGWGSPAYRVNYFYSPPLIYSPWGPRYFVGPPPWGGPRPPGWGGPRRPLPPGFRPAPPMRPMPTIPTAPRGGGRRGAPTR
jgi:hypothetical protein